jgi:hypothetical protein
MKKIHTQTNVDLVPKGKLNRLGTTPHEAEVTSSNPPFPFCVDMSKYIYLGKKEQK